MTTEQKPRLTPNQKAQLEITRIREQHKVELQNIDAQVNDHIRDVRRGSFWFGAAVFGSLAMVTGIMLGALCTFATMQAVIPYSFKTAMDMQMWNQVVQDRDEKAGEE